MTLLALAALVVAGCGSDDGDDESAGGTTVASGTPSTGADQDVSAVVLQQSDFPSGWAPEPEEPDTPENEEIDRQFDECMGMKHNPEDDDASSNFSSGDTASVSSTANLLDADEMEDDWNALTGSKLIPCTQQGIDATFAAEAGDTTFGPADVTELEYPDQGEGARALRVTITASADGEQVPVFLDLVIVRQGLIGITLNTFTVGEPFPSDLLADLGEKLVERATA